MEKLISLIAVLALLLPVINQGARAAAVKNINLACDGTLKHLLVNGGAPERIEKLGIVVSFHKKTVSFAGHTVPITKVDAANIAFGGTESLAAKPLPSKVSYAINGNIDRVTGAVDISLITKVDPQEWVLVCKPARRLF